MKINQIAFLVYMCLLQNIAQAQLSKINGTYAWDLTEFITITDDSFKLYLYPTDPIIYGLNMRDTILAEGKVQYESDNFIKLTSKDYKSDAKKNMVITDSIDSYLTDSISFNFIFPFDGMFKIIFYIGDISKTKCKYEFKNRKKVLLPACRDSILTFSFIILNQTAVEYPYRNYLKNVRFSSFQNTARNINSNSFVISIPDLTNSYFNRFLINGEYIKVNKEKGILFWNNEQYQKIGMGR